MYDEFPHVADLKEQKSTPNGLGGTTKQWEKIGEIDCFIDTPTTARLVEASKLGITVHRDMYCEYEDGMAIQTNWRIAYEGQDYELSGDVEDQGGMHEIVRIPLKKVT